MSPLILVLTSGFLALAVSFLLAAVLWKYQLWPAGLVLVAISVWVWLRFRPTGFAVRPQEIEVLWPLKRRHISRDSIITARVLDRKDLRKEIGWGLRLGAGGLWGGFGWLWTPRRGLVQMYISRTDSFVWIERAGSRPWLLTPERPNEFVRALLA